MRSSYLLYSAYALLPRAISAQASDKRAITPTSSGEIGVNPPADPVTLYHHDSYLELSGPNSHYYTEEGSTTKWIGVNSEYLTMVETAETYNGQVTSYRTTLPGAVATATADGDGLVKGDISVALAPEIVDVLNEIAAEAAAACGLRRKRQACDARLEFANRVQAEITSGGRLDFDLDFLPTISAPDVATVLQAMTGTRSKALGVIILLWILGEEDHGDSDGPPKIAPAVNIPEKVAGPTPTEPTTTTGCAPGAPTGANAPICPHDDCKGPNEVTDRSQLKCSEGQWKDCDCLHQAESIVQDSDEADYNGKKWSDHQQQFLQDLVALTIDEPQPTETPPPSNFKKTCWKQDEERMKDHHNWKFVQQEKLDEAINDWCRSFNGFKPTREIAMGKYYYEEEGDWNHVLLKYTVPANVETFAGDCVKWFMDISAGCDFDDGPIEHNRNQYNWKWGGQVTTEEGVIWEISPQKERVLFDEPVYMHPPFSSNGDAHHCYALDPFSDHGDTGLNGDPLDDKAKMTLMQCAHRLPLLDGDQEVSCGGYLNMRIHRESYDSYYDCAVNTLDCFRYYIDQGRSARGTHTPTFSNCWADFIF